MKRKTLVKMSRTHTEFRLYQNSIENEVEFLLVLKWTKTTVEIT